MTTVCDELHLVAGTPALRASRIAIRRKWSGLLVGTKLGTVEVAPKCSSTKMQHSSGAGMRGKSGAGNALAYAALIAFSGHARATSQRLRLGDCLTPSAESPTTRRPATSHGRRRPPGDRGPLELDPHSPVFDPGGGNPSARLTYVQNVREEDPTIRARSKSRGGCAPQKISAALAGMGMSSGLGSVGGASL